MSKDLPKMKVIHSDFLIHWTGKDIDDKLDPEWFSNPNSKTNNNQVSEGYIERLKDILEYGLWMTKHDEDKVVSVGNQNGILRPQTARTCFTELKISEARYHATQYGRLGIGFKRFFVIDRMGHPMVYFPTGRKTWFMPPFIGSQYSKHDYYACFLKPMYTKKGLGNERALDYCFYDESEWRIIYSEDIKESLQGNIGSYFESPQKYSDYYRKLNSTTVRPEYLIPLDSWFSMIIYPSLKVKNMAQQSKEIVNLIKNIKNRSGAIEIECQNWPIEIDLDACRNF